jgi:hypothetical protein
MVDMLSSKVTVSTARWNKVLDSYSGGRICDHSGISDVVDVGNSHWGAHHTNLKILFNGITHKKTHAFFLVNIFTIKRTHKFIMA